MKRVNRRERMGGRAKRNDLFFEIGLFHGEEEFFVLGMGPLRG